MADFLVFFFQGDFSLKQSLVLGDKKNHTNNELFRADAALNADDRSCSR